MGLGFDLVRFGELDVVVTGAAEAPSLTGSAGAAGSARPVHRIDKGAVTEAAVRDAARAGARLVLGRRAVITPLARDRARAAGVEIEKER